MKDKTREQRIFDAEAKIKGVKLVMAPYERMLCDAEKELEKAVKSFDVGERVSYEDRYWADKGADGETMTGVIVRIQIVKMNYGVEYVVKNDLNGSEKQWPGFCLQRTK